MTPKEVRETIETFPELLKKLGKLQKQLLRVSGRDPEKEMLILMRLEPIEKTIETIEKAAFENEALTIREECCLMQRMEGRTTKEIAECFSVTTATVSNLLTNAYKKIAESL